MDSFALYSEDKLFINIIIFILFSLIITYMSNKLPAGIYSYKNHFYETKKWEKEGNIYQEILKVKNWKKKLPELSDFVKSVFPKKKLKDHSEAYIKNFIEESCKSEFTHWCIIMSSFLFVFWSSPNITAFIMALSVILNLPYIIIQRFNRPRLMKLINCNAKKENDTSIYNCKI